MQIVSLFTAAMWVDFAVIVLSKFVPLTTALNKWYANFGVVAVFQDVTIIALGIALAQLIWSGIHGWNLVAAAIVIQLIHDILFYLVILAVPNGQNRIIDLFKQYAVEGSWKILVADALMIGSTVLLMEWLENNLTDNWIAFTGILAAYSLTYIIYTR